MPPKRQYSSTSSEEGGEEHALFGKRVENVEIEKAKRELFEGQAAARPSRAAARPARAPVAAQPPVAVEGQAARPSRAAARPAQGPVGSSTSSYGDDSDRDKTVNPDKLSDEDSSDRKVRKIEEKKKKKELLKKKTKQPEPKRRDPGFTSGK